MSHVEQLHALADQAARLPAYDARNPDAWHEAKSELAAALRGLALEMTASRTSTAPSAPAARAVAPGRRRMDARRMVTAADGHRVVVDQVRSRRP